MCINPISVTRQRLGRYYTDVVCCGKCDECLKKKRSSLGVLSYRTALKYGNMVFATFTYNDDALPLAFDYSRSKLIVSPFESPDNFFDIDLRSLYFSQRFDFHRTCDGKLHRIHKKVDVPFLDFQFSLCPTLCRRDWRLSIKRSRVRYERKYGYRLPEFKIFMCGEYSPICHRPHYHAVFYGLTYSQVNFLCQDWRDNFGFVQLKQVKNLHPKSDGRVACSMYVGKYVFKGSCEYENVLNGFCEKPRRISSKGFGNCDDIEPDLYRHLLALDVCDYNPSCPKFKSVRDLELVCSTILKRLYYGINGKRYSLPDGIKRRVYFVPFVDVKGAKSYRPLPIWSLVKTFIRNQFFEDFARQSEYCLQKPLSEVSVSEASFVCSLYEADRHRFLESLQKDYINFVQRSKVI